MSLKIKKQLVSNLRYTYGHGNKKRYITIHETANTSRGANAQAHANLQSRGFSSSFHWQVDDKQAIQSYPHSVSCWHAGDGRGGGNTESIAIEIRSEERRVGKEGRSRRRAACEEKKWRDAYRGVRRRKR